MMILGKNIPVEFAKLEEGYLGLYEGEKIKISENLDLSKIKEVLVHEVMHAIFDRLGYRIDHDLEEILCTAVAVTFCEADLIKEIDVSKI